MSQLNIGIAFFAGLASFISPCCLPLYPSYLSYITGISVSQLKTDSSREVRTKTMMHTLFFILGFSFVFFTLSYTANAFAMTFREYQDPIRQVSAVLIILMGLFLLGIFQPQLLLKERKLNVSWRPAGYIGSFIFGVGFSAGWSPCVGPILGSILLMAASEPGTWAALTAAYSLGFGVPFFVLAFFIGSTRWILKYSNRLMKIGGALMVVMGVLLFTDRMTYVTIWLNSITPNWLKF
ncbi:cytochrome c biogenesis CcdA family protein [Cohnella nanjingensis]|uniref:Sulfite exporter TauE/SafE family protein n=1 Tax=Cohnella nanjingensis TaxID=1387779 RepID=A0A7X0S071_9BACL|nr:cytochrome c biogenesis protein CcdA [Cohnella nanjingensis]MBB6675259.1 sulfite exporter TauE/SafE family protein [Cohnella nanjingensis]